MRGWLLLLQLLTTLSMTGILWFVQVVHYPLFAAVGRDGFRAYEAEHAERTGWVVGPLMCVELATALLSLVPRWRPTGFSAAMAWTGAGLVALVWLSTFLIQAPLHTRLAAGYDAAAVARLVATNWIRTCAWTARAALVLRAVWRVTR